MKYNRFTILLFFFLFVGKIAHAQKGVCINCPDGNPIPAADAILDVQSSTKGMLIPRMSARPGSPTDGLMFYNTTTDQLEFYDGTEWRSTGLWSGEKGGTINYDSKMYINSSGKIGIATNSLSGRLSFANVAEPKITLFDSGANDYGFGISSAQLNYHVSSSTKSHVFYAGGDNGNGTELLRILGTGNLKLKDNGDITGLDIIQGFDDLRFRSSASSTTNQLYIASNGNIGIANDNPGSRLSFENVLEPKITLYDGGANDYGFGISSAQLNYHVSSTTKSHVFYAGGNNGDGTELVRFRGNGNVGIGVTSPSAKLHVNGDIRVADDSDIYGLNLIEGFNDLRFRADAGATSDHMKIYSTGSVEVFGKLWSNEFHLFYGGVWQQLKKGIGDNAILTTSDGRLKNKVQPLQNALAKVKALSGIQYNWNEEALDRLYKDISVSAGPNATPEEDLKVKEAEKEKIRTKYSKAEIGFIAQEVEQVIPELVGTQDDGYKGIKYAQMTALLVEAIKEQQALIDQQKQQLQQQQTLISGFEARLSALEKGNTSNDQPKNKTSVNTEER